MFLNIPLSQLNFLQLSTKVESTLRFRLSGNVYLRGFCKKYISNLGFGNSMQSSTEDAMIESMNRKLVTRAMDNKLGTIYER